MIKTPFTPIIYSDCDICVIPLQMPISHSNMRKINVATIVSQIPCITIFYEKNSNNRPFERKKLIKSGGDP